MSRRCTALIATLALCAGAAAAAQAPAAGRTGGEVGQSCLSLGRSPAGPFATDTANLMNNCPARVSFQYCVRTARGGGVYSCERQKFGSGAIRASAATTISVLADARAFQVLWGYCVATPERPAAVAVAPRYDPVAERVEVECR